MAIYLNLKNHLSVIATGVMLTVFTGCSSGDFSGSSGASKPAKPAEQSKKPTPSPVVPNPSPLPSSSPPEVKDDLYIGGSDIVYHIGDGVLDPNSECYSEVTGQGLKGTTFIFGFDVTQSGVQTTISIDKVCGTDISSNSVTMLKDGAGYLPSAAIGRRATSFQFGTLTLVQGHYDIVVKSDKFQNDYDDFLVGKIHIKANKSAIKPGTVTSQ